MRAVPVTHPQCRNKGLCCPLLADQHGARSHAAAPALLAELAERNDGLHTGGVDVVAESGRAGRPVNGLKALQAPAAKRILQVARALLRVVHEGIWKSEGSNMLRNIVDPGTRHPAIRQYGPGPMARPGHAP